MRIAALVLASLLSSCASVPDGSTGRKTADSEVVDQSLLRPAPDRGSVTIKRDSWPLHGYRLGLYVDGKRIGTIGDGEVFQVFLPEGRRLIGVSRSAESLPTSELGLEVGTKPVFVHLKLSAWGWGGWDIEESSH